MALERDDLRTILEVLRSQPRRDRLLILGDVTIHVSPRELDQIAASTGFSLSERPDQLDPFSLGRAMGFGRTETLDVNGRASLNIDLHQIPAQNLLGAFDCVIDAGVLFWCSDPGAALRSILSMTRVGGTIVHVCAVSGHFGRGYYNVHPLLFEDFYLSNGCEFAATTYRPKFRPRRVARLVAAALGVRNRLTRSDAPGQVYLSTSLPHKITFASTYHRPVEANMVPNNVLGVFAFTKQRDSDIQMPVRSSAYSPAERPR